MPKDKDIDYSDTSETDESFWMNAKVTLPQQKRLITIRLDSEIITPTRTDPTNGTNDATTID